MHPGTGNRGFSHSVWYIMTEMSVHLMVRSCYTLLDSTIRIPAYVQKVREAGFRHAVLSDRNVLHGFPSFLKECQKNSIHAICGLEAEVLYHEETVPFLLLAKDNIGYRNLIRLSSLIANQQRPASLEELVLYSSHCFLIAYGEGGWLDQALIEGNSERISAMLTEMKQELPVFDVGLSYQNASLWKERNRLLKRLCQIQGIRTAALNKVYYLNKEDASDYRILTGIRTQKTLNDPTLQLLSGRYLLSEEEMKALYDADDLARTEEIANECRADFQLEKTSLPAYTKNNDTDSASYLPRLCMAGLKKRLNNRLDPVYVNRLQYELGVIAKMHFEDYFLIVYDFIRYARKNGIYVGPGRGSAAGSLVSYCLGITMIDPLKYNLLFERFLNPERISMPDIDTDIPDDRREEVLQYVYETYGEDHVANIVTFGTLAARQVIRDVGKVMNINPRDITSLSRLIPNLPKMTLDKALAENRRLKQMVESDEKLNRLFIAARRLEGLPRHASVHAAGIIMSSKKLEDVIPTMRLAEGMRTSQFTMDWLEERGLIKMDFLGLRNLSLIDEIVTRIKQEDPDFNIMNIPLDDEKTYRLFSAADTVGVFQFESEGMKSLLRKMKPQNFADITAALALYRPASMESIPRYIENRKNPAAIRWPAASLEGILKDTYGVMIYQEQAMLTAQICAGFSLARADVLRKAMSKKKEDELAALREEFISGCLKNGYMQNTAEELFELVSRFGGYGFNKSHAVAYSLVAYQLAYLKANMPQHFYTALLNHVIGDENRTSLYIDECRRRQIVVYPPHINYSTDVYLQKDAAILCPLSIIKGVGVHASAALMAEREQGGLFRDFYDFTARSLIRKITRPMIEALIDAGALDCFRLGRTTMRNCLDEAISYSELVQIRRGEIVTIDLGLVSKPQPVRMKDDEEEISEREKKALGFNLGLQPVVIVREKNGINVPRLASVHMMKGTIRSFGVIRSVHQHRTKKGDMMAFLKISDETAEADMAVMPSLYRNVSQNLVRGAYILFDAKISDDGSLLANSITVVEKK